MSLAPMFEDKQAPENSTVIPTSGPMLFEMPAQHVALEPILRKGLDRVGHGRSQGATQPRRQRSIETALLTSEHIGQNAFAQGLA